MTDPEPGEQRVVRGSVVFVGGRGIAGALVVALHKQLRAEAELDQSVTDAAGAYVITYQAGGSVTEVAQAEAAPAGATDDQSPPIFRSPRWISWCGCSGEKKGR